MYTADIPPPRAPVHVMAYAYDIPITSTHTSTIADKKTGRKMNLLKVLNSLSDVNARIMKNIYTVPIQSTLEHGAVTFGMMEPSNIDRLQVFQNQGMRLILRVPRGTSAKMMRHELHMLPNYTGRLEETQTIHYTLQSTGDNEIGGPLRYRNVTDLHQDNWRNQHIYKEMTPPHGNNYHTNVG